MNKKKTRLAPSPTGALHLGNACSFLLTWAIARRNKWELLYRLEDLCGQRKMKDGEKNALDTFKWMGIDWDGEIIKQSDDIQPYIETFQLLKSKNLAYHCQLTRKEIELASNAPHQDANLAHGAHRPANIAAHNESINVLDANWRFATSLNPIQIKDKLQGDHDYVINEDFVIWTREDLPAYQLSVVVDDNRHKITDVIRANDLLESSARQTQLNDSLGWDSPNWWHLPIIIGEDGRRLAKRHGDTRVLYFKEQGVPKQQIIGLIAYWCKFQEHRVAMNLENFLAKFDSSVLPRDTITCSKEDIKWLLNT